MEQTQEEAGAAGCGIMLCGALIGAGAILPGVSGGVLAVVFDVYRPMMETLTHPERGFRKYWHIFLPLGIGWADRLSGACQGYQRRPIALSAAATMWLFIGLIARDVPGPLAGGGKGGPQPRRVGRLRCLRPGGVSVAFSMCATCCT